MIAIFITIIIFEMAVIVYLIHKYAIPLWKLLKNDEDEKLYNSIMKEIEQIEKSASPLQSEIFVCPKCGKKFCDPVDPCYCWLLTDSKDFLDDD